MVTATDLTLETVLRYPIYDQANVLLLRGGSTLTPRLLDLLHMRQISLAVYATLEVLEASGERTEVALKERPIVIGRGPTCDLRPAHAVVSKKHCAFRKVGYSVVVRDLQSTNGTFVNGARASGLVELSDGDVITLGGLMSMTVHIFAAVRGDYGADGHGLVLGGAGGSGTGMESTALATTLTFGGIPESLRRDILAKPRG